MRAAALIASLGLLACKDNSSKLDKSTDDPWEGGGSAGSAMPLGGTSGFDWQGMLERIQEAIKTPGPYESPKHSKDFDETKPHWAVMGMEGEIVEREAFSITGG